jgi:MoxR-like ATPase
MSVFPAPVFDPETVPVKDRTRIEALIPSERVAKAYAHRHVEGWYDFDLLDYAMMKSKNVILAGPTGSSKTTLFRAYASHRRLPFFAVECNGAMDPGVIVGRTSIMSTEDGTAVSEFIDGDMTLIVRYGGVTILDDVNLAHQRVTAAWFGLLSVMRAMSIPEAGEIIQAGAGGLGERQQCLFGAAYNPRYQGTVRLNEALGNRYPQPYEWDYDRSVEEQLIKSKTLLDEAYNMRSMADVRTPVSTNMLMEYVEHARDLDQRMAEYWFKNHFPSDERGPVVRALQAGRVNIARELGLPDPDLSDIEAESKDDEVEVDVV